MSSKLILYYMSISPPSRFALLTAKLLGLDIEVRNINLLEGEQFSPEYKEINPTSTVPALIDGDVKVYDSSAIAIYLVEKYAKDDSLYPKDLIQRTRVNETLFYVSSYMFRKLSDLFIGSLSGLEPEIPMQTVKAIERGYGTIEIFLTGKDYLTGNKMRLSDLSLWCLMESLCHFVPIEKYPNLSVWLKKMRLSPYAEMNKRRGNDDYEVYRKIIGTIKNFPSN